MKLLILFLLTASVHADWWDTFTDTVSDGITSVGKWVKETASPVVREKFNEAKETLQDPVTHKNIREWVSQKAEHLSEFANREIVPELKKIYDAATADDVSSSTTERSA